MPKPNSIVGKVQNKKFAYFWLLIGGSVGNIVILLYAISGLPFLILQTLISLFIVAYSANKKRRPKLLLGIDGIISLALIAYLFSGFNPGSFLPTALILLGCILGIMDW